MKIRYIKVKGTSEERGQIIGKRLRDNILTLLKSQEEADKHKDGLALHDWLPHAKTLLPFISEYAPNTFAEMKGIAKGAGLPFDDILLLACVYEKWMNYHTPEHCTGFAAMGKATKNGDLICGQNNDEVFHTWAAGQLDTVIHHMDDSGLESLIYTHPGIPAYMGMNSAGLCVLWMTIDNGEHAPGVPSNVLVRELLCHKTLDSALAYLKDIPRAVPNNFLLARQTEGICNIECSPTDFHPVYSKTSLGHANHILDEKMSVNDLRKNLPEHTTFPRYDAMAAWLKTHNGLIDIASAKQILSDHTHSPASICVHPYPQNIYGKTLASMAFDPATGSMHIAFGNGCETPYIKYSFDG